jgi:hypothetical protein
MCRSVIFSHLERIPFLDCSTHKKCCAPALEYNKVTMVQGVGGSRFWWHLRMFLIGYAVWLVSAFAGWQHCLDDCQKSFKMLSIAG